jgi:protein ImuA
MTPDLYAEANAAAESQPESGPTKARTLASLRQRLQALGAGRHGLLPLGAAALDAALGGGLVRGGLHEILAGGEGAATGFCAALAARLSVRQPSGPARPVLWIVPAGGRYAPELFAPGLAALGLDPARLILATARRTADRLWAMEEALRCPALAAVATEVDTVEPVALRRLQLAAEGSGVAALLLRGGGGVTERGGAAVTRWRVASAPGCRSEIGPRWRLALLRCRGGRTGEWLVEWSHETGDFAVVAALRDGPAEADRPAPRRLGGDAAALAPLGAG